MTHLGTPTPIVEQGAEHIEPGSLVLDMGSSDGRNSLYLASLGSIVVGVDIVPDDLLRMKRQARCMGMQAVRGTNPVLGDQDMPPFRDESFDSVVCTAALQFSKLDKKLVVGGLQRLTKPGGINIVSAYFGSTNDQLLKMGYTVFSQYELTDLYEKAGWELIYSDEIPRPIGVFHSEFTGLTTTSIRSMADVIAKKPGGKETSKQPSGSLANSGTYLGHDREYWFRRDPEMYNYLVQSGVL